MLPIFAIAFSATPQQAALRAVGSPPLKAIVKRINIAGPYAAVLTGGGIMEGDAVRVPILVKRFAFGWQPLEYLNTRCRLATQVPSAAMRRTLMAGMPALQNDAPCRGEPHDSGPAADVTALRRLMDGPLVPSVVVSGNWALGSWYGAGGGEQLYHRLNGRWRFIAGGGGAMNVEDLLAHGVLRSTACALVGTCGPARRQKGGSLPAR